MDNQHYGDCRQITIMDAEKKAARLELIRKAAEKHREANELAFAGIAPTRADVQEAVGDMDTFREEQLSRRRTSDVINSDEA